VKIFQSRDTTIRVGPGYKYITTSFKAIMLHYQCQMQLELRSSPCNASSNGCARSRNACQRLTELAYNGRRTCVTLAVLTTRRFRWNARQASFQGISQ